VGWYWVSEEPWAWACYHYGSWQFDPYYGWVWIPGTEWAPAWVTWRESNDYIGWAPCGPRGTVLPASLFVFVDTGHFREHHFRPEHFVVNNRTIINRTRVVNNFQRETRTIEGARQTVVVNRGPRMELVQRSSRTPLTPVPITRVVNETPIPSNVRHATWRENVVQQPSSGNREQFRSSQERQQQTAPRQQQPAVVTPAQNERQRLQSERPAQPVPAPIQTPSTRTEAERGNLNREHVAPREQPPVVVRPQPSVRERVPAQSAPTVRQQPPFQTPPTAAGRERVHPNRDQATTQRQLPPVVVTPQPEQQRVPAHPAPIVREQPPVQVPPTPTGRERGREQFNSPPSQVAPPREQPVPREAVPERKVVPERQGPPPENTRGRDREKDRDKD
jgi:hypothetical protein